MSYQFDGEFIEKFYLTFTMLAYESNRRFYPVGEVVGPMDKYKFTRNEVDMLFFLNSCVDKKVKPQHDFKDIDMNILSISTYLRAFPWQPPAAVWKSLSKTGLRKDIISTTTAKQSTSELRKRVSDSKRSIGSFRFRI